MKGLSAYESKRALKKTPEPKPRPPKKSQGLIFVVQKHDASHLHYDFRLELDGVLKSWAVPKGPPTSTREKRLAIMVEDHPYEYKNFEGVIPKGNYGAGRVEIWDQGTYSIAGAHRAQDAQVYMREGLKKGHVRFELKGARLNGAYSLIKTPRPGSPNAWLLLKLADEGSQTTIHEPKIALDPWPKLVKPMLAQIREEPFNDQDWLFEIKWDGYRALAIVHQGKVKLLSRNQKLFNKQFPRIAADLKVIKQDVILDGELVILDAQGRSQFQLMQNYQRCGEGDLFYYIFDVLYCDGLDVRDWPLLERKKKLEILLAPLKASTHLRYSDHIEAQGIKFFKEAQKLALEGIMAKNAHSAYHMGRSSDWLKIKTHLRQEFVIGGFTAPRGNREHFGSLLVGVYRGKSLHYLGRVGTGFSQQTLNELAAKLKALRQKHNPFEKLPPINQKVTFVKPDLVAEISFAEWTNDGFMRHPVFRGLRIDKKAREVGEERGAH